MLEVEHLSVSYGGIQAVRDGSFVAEDGVITCVIGRNGAGKSSLVQAIAGLVSSSGGRVTLDGRDLGGKSASARARLGVSLVPEDRRIFGSLRVRENLELAAGGRLGSDRLRAVLDVFPKLADLMERGGHEISGGEQQMVAIARALLRRPRILILDEPSLGLAPFVLHEVFRAVSAIAAQGQSVLLIEQNAHAALAIAEHAYAMSLGRVRSLGRRPNFIDGEELKELYL